MRFSGVLLLILSFFSLIQAAEGSLPESALKTAAELRDFAVVNSKAYDIVESLTTEVGPRRAGTPGDRAAVLWAEAKLKELGFDKVWLEPVSFPFWIRGEASCQVVSPFPQEFHVTALGNSVGTPDQGIEAEVLQVANFEELKNMGPNTAAGKIVFINNRMEREKKGAGYGKAVVARAAGASAAASVGALAVIIRSIGTDSHRFAHTGVMSYREEVGKIPAAAISNPDANQLEQMLRRGKPVRIKLTMSCRDGGTATSHNVIGEITGREKPEEVVVIGGHLDSWDLGTGALDDGAGVAITTEAARLIGQLPQRPRRTIRVVLFANEESGLFGGKAYAEAHQADLQNHIMGAESDFGAGVIWSFLPRVDEAALPTMEQIHKVLEPLGISLGPNEGGGGPDLGPMRQLGMAVATLSQDGSDYFDYHHTADDTLDKINVESMNQNVAAYAVFAYLAAEAPIRFNQPADQISGTPEH